MHKMALNKLILAAGSVVLHLAIIVWIFSSHAGGVIKPEGAHHPPVNVFLISLATPLLPRAPTKVAATVTNKKAVARPLSITLTRQPTVEPAPSYYFPLNELERGPLPKSEPDLQQVMEKSITNLPIRLRIFIDRFGTVDKVIPSETETVDLDFVNAVATIFCSTSFLPGRLNGIDVPSFIDVEINANGAPLHLGISALPCPTCSGLENRLPPVEN